MEIKSKKNAIAGYMGYIPTVEPNERSTEENSIGESHIPGYVGYIPAVKSENLYAKTYGKITENCARGNYNKGIELPLDVKYTSTTKQTYVHPNSIKAGELSEGKINGVKMSTFSSAAKWMIDSENKKDFTPQLSTSLTYERACQQAYR